MCSFFNGRLFLALFGPSLVPRKIKNNYFAFLVCCAVFFVFWWGGALASSSLVGIAAAFDLLAANCQNFQQFSDRLRQQLQSPIKRKKLLTRLVVMVQLLCSLVCSNQISSELFLSHKYFGDDFSIGEYVAIELIEYGVKLPCRISKSRPFDEITRLNISPILGLPYASENPLRADICVMPFHLYMVPLAKTLVVSVPLALLKLVSPSTLKQQLNNHIVSVNQRISCLVHENGTQKRLHFVIKSVSGNCDEKSLEQYMSMCKISRYSTQVFVEPEEPSGFNERVPEEVGVSRAYKDEDVHGALRGYIRNSLCARHQVHRQDGSSRISSGAVSSVLLVGRSGCAKSQMVEEEAEAVSAACLRIAPASLVHLDESGAAEALHSVFVAALIRQPCLIIVEMLELCNDTKYSSIMTKIVNVSKNADKSTNLSVI
jgi:hypothetical protein